MEAYVMDIWYMLVAGGSFLFGLLTYRWEKSDILNDMDPPRKRRREKLRDLFWGFLGIVSLPTFLCTTVAVYWHGDWYSMNMVATALVSLMLGGVACAQWSSHRRRRRRKKLATEERKRTAA
jgi:hypothetical protein